MVNSFNPTLIALKMVSQLKKNTSYYQNLSNYFINMGNIEEQQFGTPIDNNIIALLLSGQTAKVINRLEADPSGTFFNDSINFRNDNLLHYACAKNNGQLAEYIMKKNPKLCSLRNSQNELPADLATDQAVKAVCRQNFLKA